MVDNYIREQILQNNGDALKVIKRKVYEEALIMAYGNVSKAARMIGVSRSSMNIFANKWQPKDKAK